MESGHKTHEIACKAALAVVCLLAAFLPVTDDIPVSRLAGALLAISCSALAQWLLLVRPSRSGLPAAIFSVLAIVIPHFAAFIPIIAYDAARSPSPSSMSVARTLLFTRLRNAQRWLWTVPLARSLLFVSDMDRLHAVSMIALAILGFAAGALGMRNAMMESVVRDEKDRFRAMRRHWRTTMADNEQERGRSVRAATLDERTRIAREIHDNVGHLLTRGIMQAQASTVVAEARGDAESAQHLAAIRTTLDEAMTMIRKSVHDLDDHGTDFGRQLDETISSFDEVSPGFAVAVDNGIAQVPAPVARCLTSVIREALTNVVRHSASRTATVTLRDYPALWQLVIFDPGEAGRGAGASAASSAGISRASSISSAGNHSRPQPGGGSVSGNARGMGLADIEARVRTLGGTSLCGPYSTGWRVFVSIPKTPWAKRERSGSTASMGDADSSGHARAADDRRHGAANRASAAISTAAVFTAVTAHRAQYDNHSTLTTPKDASS
ncbi:sensor histidine kinase [Bifidobacterium tibiigranuli]|uniref:sensor histidine kinase n=1 Tax=Bifidobacterium tibiigranuli TaxID=2172043 RepID=UPI0026F35CEE|nr:histidine kinase [Bifidobacterium tibiigranuli]MCI1649140.1 histidine kinase [Bifidobacterium tibiigranuli]MCI2185558.1 histidine kinase [Bifidobacterium tibiigranuli]MCI2203467.1 histidine kinase [Bifidobacterium tibiigranuli]